MAFSLVQSATGTSATAITHLAFSRASTPGNLVVLAIASDDYNNTPDSGWTQSTGMEQQTFCGGYLWWRISAGETSFQYTINSATNSAWVLAEFSGNAASPYDISNGQFQQTSTNNYTTPSIIPTAGDRLLLAAMAGSLGSSQAANTWGTWLNGFSAVGTIGSSGSGSNDLVGLAYQEVTANGSTGYSSGATATNVQQAKVGLIISFEAAVAAATYGYLKPRSRPLLRR